MLSEKITVNADITHNFQKSICTVPFTYNDSMHETANPSSSSLNVLSQRHTNETVSEFRDNH